MTQQSFLGDAYKPIIVRKLDGATETVDAEIVGQLAVHPALEESGWTITHVLSGEGLILCIVTYTHAVELAHQFAALDFDAYYQAGYCAPIAFYDKANQILKKAGRRYVGRETAFGRVVVGKICGGES